MGRNKTSAKRQCSTCHRRLSKGRTHERLSENGYHFDQRLIPCHHEVCKTTRGPRNASEGLMNDSLSVLSTTELSFSYGSRKTVDRVNLQLRAGTLTALVGPNGAGKSTLLQLLEGRLKPSNGSINSSKRIGMMPQSCLLYTSPSPRDKRQSRMPSSA